jgi:hypothetical protein
MNKVDDEIIRNAIHEIVGSYDHGNIIFPLKRDIMLKPDSITVSEIFNYNSRFKIYIWDHHNYLIDIE